MYILHLSYLEYNTSKNPCILLPLYILSEGTMYISSMFDTLKNFMVSIQDCHNETRIYYDFFSPNIYFVTCQTDIRVARIVPLVVPSEGHMITWKHQLETLIRVCFTCLTLSVHNEVFMTCFIKPEHRSLKAERSIRDQGPSHIPSPFLTGVTALKPGDLGSSRFLIFIL